MLQKLALSLVAIHSIATTECASVRSYYVDCAQGSDESDGRSEATAWGSLTRLNAQPLLPGDSVRLKRGTICAGALRPNGSGTAGEPIVLGAYGDGPLPVVFAAGASAALRLEDQGGWEVSELELTGSGPYGVLITASTSTVSHIRLSNLRVHDVYAGEIAGKATGLVVVVPEGVGGRFEDVTIDGVTAWNTDQWSGIFFYGAFYESGTELSRSIAIRNSTVHDVFGDGIVVFGARDALIETSVAYRAGLQPEQTLGTPNGIWTWYCDRCTVQYNEGYEIYSPGVDGGVYDIDWATSSNVVQYNYGHHAQAYCVSVFGAEGWTTSEAVIRYNVCAHNGRISPESGDVQLFTWAGGSIDGVEIYNNTFYWDPPSSWPVLVDEARYTGTGRRLFQNNIVYSTSDWLVHTTLGLEMERNLYWHSAQGQPWFTVSKGQPLQYRERYEGLTEWQSETGLDAHSLWADPLLAGDGAAGPGDFQLSEASPAIDAGARIEGAAGCDFWGGELVDGAPDIGAHEFGAPLGPACGS